MANEQDQPQEQLRVRSPEEIQERIRNIEKRIANAPDIQVKVGEYETPMAYEPLTRKILKIRLSELRWLIGENVSVDAQK